MRLFVGDLCQTTGQTFPDRSKRLTLKRNIANFAGKWTIKMAFPQFSELWKLVDLLVRKDFRQANLATEDRDNLVGVHNFSCVSS